MAALRFPVSSILFNHLEGLASSGNHVNGDDTRIMSSSNNLNNSSNIRDFPESASSSYAAAAITTSFSMAYLPQTLVLCELRHDGFEERVSSGPSNSGLIAKWWPRDPMKTGCVALVLCLNNSVDPPNIIKISPFARMECWIDPSSLIPQEALKKIGLALTQQYEMWQPRARCKLSSDPTMEEVKKLCITCRKHAKSERVLFHYNGHGVPKPTANGEIWLFNKSFMQYIPLPINKLDSWLKTPSMYVFDCSAAGMIVNAFVQLQDCSILTSGPSRRDFILLAACEAHECLPQSVEFPADMFTSCLTTPIKMALTWFCPRSLLESSDYSLIDKIPVQQTDRKTLLGELNWIFTAVTDTIAWNVLPQDLFQRLFRQDVLVASLFRNYLLAERIMRSVNCSPISYPPLPSTHRHHMWDAWDMASEICLAQLPNLLEDPNAEFLPSSFFTDQLTAFEVWLDHGSEHKKPPEQLPIVLQVLLSQCHRFRALELLGRYLDMGPWAVNQALSVGIFPYILKLLRTTTPELQQILVFIWTKILALDKSCQVDLVKDGGHAYFIRFLDSDEAYPEQQAVAAFVLAVIVDGHRSGQEACTGAGLIHVCIRHLQGSFPNELHNEPVLLQWLCLCLGKLWEDFMEAQMTALQLEAPDILAPLLLEPQPEVWAAAIFALGTLLDVEFNASRDGQDCNADEKTRIEVRIFKSLLCVVSDGSPLVRAEVAVALSRFAFGHNKHLKSVAVANWKPQSSSVLTSLPSFVIKGSSSVHTTSSHYRSQGSIASSTVSPLLRVKNESQSVIRDDRVSASSPLAIPGILDGSPPSDDPSLDSDSGILNDCVNNGDLNHIRPRPLDNAFNLKCVLAMCTLAKDPSPHVSSLGRRVLSTIGIEQVVAKSVKSSGGSVCSGESMSIPNPHLAGLARSSSWFELNRAGHFLLTFRTPPVSLSRPSYLGMRRVCSQELRPRLMNSPVLGLADPCLGSDEPSGVSETRYFPQSIIYNWSCGHFSKQLLTAADDGEEMIARREESEKIVLDHILKCQLSSVSKLHKKIASWDTKFETGTNAALLQPFLPVVIAADEKERIRVWNYEEDTLLNSFDNHDYPDKGISRLCLINELDENLLLVASKDGNIRIWKDYMSKGHQKLVTAFSSVQGNRPGAHGVNTVVDWQQQSGFLFTSGEMSSIMAWDMDKEQLVNTIPSISDCSISALSASHVHGGQFSAGYVNGYIRLFDIRTPEMLVGAARPHNQRVVEIGFQTGLEPSKIFSASQAGDIQFLDIRNLQHTFLTIDAHQGSLSAFSVHRHASLIASGSTKEVIKVFNMEGHQLGNIKSYPTFISRKIGPVSCLTFHPYQVRLAAGATNPFVSIYAE